MRYKYHKQYRRRFQDYSEEGMYFITVCTKNRVNYFGKIVNGEMILSNIGEIIKRYYLEIPNHFTKVRLDEFIIMPNHIHGIIDILFDFQQIKENFVGTGHRPVLKDLKTNPKKISEHGSAVFLQIIIIFLGLGL